MTAEPRQLRLRYPAVCATCGTALPAGSTAVWHATTKQAHCLEHEPGLDAVVGPAAEPAATASGSLAAELEPDVATGVAGASAQREFERRRAKREERIRAEHPHIGGLILALTGDPQSTRAWAIGADGERELSRRFDEVAARGAVALHDRRIPGTRANIDHIVVAPAGVFVVDAKKYTGKVEKRDVGGLFRRDERLYVGRRDCSKLLEGMQKQLAVVRGVLETQPDLAEIPVAGTLCFVEAEWSFFARPIHLQDVTVTWPRALVQSFEASDILAAERITEVARVVGQRLPPA